MYNMTNLINTAECYIRQLLKEQILPSHYKEKIIFFFFFYFASIGDGGCSLNLPWSSPHDVWNQIMLDAINLYRALCQLYLSKTGRKNSLYIYKAEIGIHALSTWPIYQEGSGWTLLLLWQHMADHLRAIYSMHPRWYSKKSTVQHPKEQDMWLSGRGQHVAFAQPGWMTNAVPQWVWT